MIAPWMEHGGALESARRHYGGAAEQWIDLSTGISPWPWPGASAIAPDWRRLPEAGALRRLEALAAVHFGADPRHVCAVPGTEIALRLTGRLLEGPARHIAPGYRTHGEMVAGSRALPRAEPLCDAPGHDDTLIIANPHNPDGRLLPPERIGTLLSGRGKDRWLIVDEAFADCHPQASVAGAVRDDRRLIVFRSFGKFFGLAGVRLGFVVAPTAFITALRSLIGAWPLSAAALAIGTAAYADRPWIDAARDRLAAAAAALDQRLRVHGLQPVGACPLFRLVESETAPDLFERLARAAILTRPFADRAHWLRIGLPPDEAALDRLDAAIGHG